METKENGADFEEAAAATKQELSAPDEEITTIRVTTEKVGFTTVLGLFAVEVSAVIKEEEARFTLAEDFTAVEGRFDADFKGAAVAAAKED